MEPAEPEGLALAMTQSDRRGDDKPYLSSRTGLDQPTDSKRETRTGEVSTWMTKSPAWPAVGRSCSTSPPCPRLASHTRTSMRPRGRKNADLELLGNPDAFACIRLNYATAYLEQILRVTRFARFSLEGIGVAGTATDPLSCTPWGERRPGNPSVNNVKSRPIGHGYLRHLAQGRRRPQYGHLRVCP
jgi:hypothetical protein